MNYISSFLFFYNHLQSPSQDHKSIFAEIRRVFFYFYAYWKPLSKKSHFVTIISEVKIKALIHENILKRSDVDAVASSESNSAKKLFAN